MPLGGKVRGAHFEQEAGEEARERQRSGEASGQAQDAEACRLDAGMAPVSQNLGVARLVRYLLLLSRPHAIRI